MKFAVLSSCALGLVVSVAACGGGGGDERDACNPLGADTCAMPWPSMAYAVADSATASGYRVSIPVDAMPENIDGVSVDPVPFGHWDGFSAIGPILVRFPGGVAPDGLPPHSDPSRSLAADSPIILVNIDTGERAPFFAELDMNVRDAAQRTLIIRPLARLQTGARYGVAIRNTVKSATGGELPVSEGFAAARDGGDFDHPLWEQTTAGFDALFARLEAQGVTRDQLVLAWDFVVASDDFLRTELSSMVSQALPAIGTDGANLSFTITEEKPPGASYKLYVGTFKSPNFLTNGETDSSEMVRDANGVPQMQGMRDANFAAIIPACVATQPLPRPTILFGHGLFGGSEDYLDDGFVQDIAEDYCFVVIAGDFIGLTMRQLALAPLAANDGNKAHWISDKLAQSVVDFIALEHAIRGPMRGAPEFAYQGTPVINASRVYYLGGSLGGIMGNTFMAYDPNITRGVLAVPGGNWSMLFERSSAWTILSGALAGSYPDPGVQQMLVAMMGMTLERVDPMTTASKVLADPMPGVPPKNILMWMAIGDSLVTNLATEMTARTMGIDVVGPSVKQPWGMDVMAATMPNGLVVIDEHPTPLPSEFNMPEDDNGTHGGCNRRAALLRMTEQFVLQGDVTMGCEVGGTAAPCDCDTGACD